MNEYLRNFIMETIRKMIASKSVPEWQVREYSIGWYSKGVLTEQDLHEIEDSYKQPIKDEKAPATADDEITVTAEILQVESENTKNTNEEVEQNGD